MAHSLRAQQSIVMGKEWLQEREGPLTGHPQSGSRESAASELASFVFNPGAHGMVLPTFWGVWRA